MLKNKLKWKLQPETILPIKICLRFSLSTKWAVLLRHTLRICCNSCNCPGVSWTARILSSGQVSELQTDVTIMFWGKTSTVTLRAGSVFVWAHARSAGRFPYKAFVSFGRKHSISAPISSPVILHSLAINSIGLWITTSHSAAVAVQQENISLNLYIVNEKTMLSMYDVDLQQQEGDCKQKA